MAEGADSWTGHVGGRGMVCGHGEWSVLCAWLWWVFAGWIICRWSLFRAESVGERGLLVGRATHHSILFPHHILRHLEGTEILIHVLQLSVIRGVLVPVQQLGDGRVVIVDHTAVLHILVVTWFRRCRERGQTRVSRPHRHLTLAIPPSQQDSRVLELRSPMSSWAEPHL